MRRLTLVYSMIAIWTFGWMAGSFGLLLSLFASLILFAPAVFAWRMLASHRAVRRREYVYLGAATLLAIVATAFVIVEWYDSGMDRLAMFDREYHAFQRHVSSVPEFKNVEVSYTRRKGGRVYLHGYVANNASYDRLLHTYERMVRNDRSGFHDGIDYPKKLTGNEQKTEAHQTDAKVR